LKSASTTLKYSKINEVICGVTLPTLEQLGSLDTAHAPLYQYKITS
jgi:hypothetical protein